MGPYQDNNIIIATPLVPSSLPFFLEALGSHVLSLPQCQIY